MSSWHLIAPDLASLDTIWRSPNPFVLWPVCEKPLLAYWLDEAVRQGIESVSIEALDRPHVIRHWLDHWDLWSRSIEVHSRAVDREGKQCFHLNGLPGSVNSHPVNTPNELMKRWYDLQVESLNQRAGEKIHLDYEYRPGIWLGPGVSVPEETIFIAPCWVGGYTKIGGRCRLGPHAFIGAGSFVNDDAEVIESIVCENTFVGSHITLKNMVAQGGNLIDLKRGIRVEVSENFVISSLGIDGSKPGLFERFTASLFAPLVEWIALFVNRGKSASRSAVSLPGEQTVELTTYPSGPLCLRRTPWLRLISKGKMKFFGVLPRDKNDWESLSPEARFVIENAPVGVFSLSDLYGCHSPKDPDEWMHALYQASKIHELGTLQVFQSFLKTLFLSPRFP